MRASILAGSYRVLLALLLAMALPAPAGHAEDAYSIDQRFGDIAFSVSHLGLFTSEGQFRRFDGNLTMDPAHPERTRITVDVHAASVSMSWPEGVAMLESPAYFDVQHYPEIRFQSSEVNPIGPDHYLVRGTLEIRGVMRPQTLDAALTGRHFDPAWHADVGDFVVTGKLKRSAFGMTSDETFISDTVSLQIHVRLKLDEAPGEG